MDLVLNNHRGVLWAARLDPPFAFQSPFYGLDFALFLVVFHGSVEDQAREGLCDAVVESGCRFAVCVGHGGKTWSESLDASFLDRDLDEGDDGSFLLTASHQGEAIDEAAFFFANGMRHEDTVARNFLVLCLGGDEAAYMQVLNMVVSLFSAPVL